MSRKNPALKKLSAEYRKRKSEIKRRLKEFSLIHKGRDEDIFRELSFCILTPQAKAVSCDNAIKRLNEKGLLLKGCARAIKPHLKGAVRFHNKKAEYLVLARRLFQNGKGLDLKVRIDMQNPFDAREWLVANIKGLGYKEASHFLRNIGLGKEIAILDRHILKNLKRCGVIAKIPSSLGDRKAYLEIEEKVRKFCKDIGIPMAELDLLFWATETGYIFK